MVLCCDCPHHHLERDDAALLSPGRARSSSEPPRRRGCTDVLCLALFAIVLAVAGATASVALQMGDPQRLTHGVDYTGQSARRPLPRPSPSLCRDFPLSSCAASAAPLTNHGLPSAHMTGLPK